MTRQHGVVTSAAGLIPFGHLGWGYHDRGEFLHRAAEYIADGLANQQWVEYVGAGTREELRAELASVPGVADVNDVRITPAPEFYGVPSGSDIVDPEVAVSTRSAAVQRAIDEGYSGFRAIVDCTSVSQTAQQREAFARFEFLIDQKMAVLPVSALCAYDLGRLPENVSALVCLHPYVNRKAPAFRLYAEPGADFALDGEIDSANEAVLLTALDHIWPLAGAEEIVVDVGGLDFISHRQLLKIDEYARQGDAVMLLRNPQPILSRVAELIDLTNIRLV